ncbi:MAG: alpha/beta hydrolase family protein [Erythrobacter sp.]
MASIAQGARGYGAQPTREIRTPNRLWTWSEGRAMFELAAFYASMPMLSMLPRGDGHSVMVLPGFLATNTSTRPMRNLLARLGYDVQGWESGRNVKVNQAMLSKLEGQLARLNDESGGKVSIVGWSLGGVLAREVAKLHSDRVRQVISLGSPLSNNRNFSSVTKIFEMLNGKEPELIQDGRFDQLHVAPPVPTTSILTKTDGIVHWHASVQEEGEHPSENIVVHASHCGLGVNPSVMMAIADRLSQEEGDWSPFEAPAGASWMYSKVDPN